MNISDKGLDLIRSFEGYLKALPDGGCKSYRCPAGVWTIGFGVTEGVVEGLVWTREQADAAFRREIAKHERIVTRLVTIDMTQGMYDALCSFSFNCGGLAGSTLLRKLNAGDVLGAADEFRNWTKATVNGKKVVLPGLVRRRKAESALFVSDLPGAERMPQAALETAPVSHATVAAGAVTTGAGAVTAGAAVLEAVAPSSPVDDVLAKSAKHIATAKQVQGQAAEIKGLAKDAKSFAADPVLLVAWALLAALAAGAIWLIWRRR